MDFFFSLKHKASQRGEIESVVLEAILFLSTNPVYIIPSNVYPAETGQGIRTSADEPSFQTMLGQSTSPEIS